MAGATRMLKFCGWILLQDLRNVVPLCGWLLSIIAVKSLRGRRTRIRVLGKKMGCRMAHMGTIKESIFDDGYSTDGIDGDVLDCGANVGFSRLAIERQMKSGRYVCVEPDPANVGLLRKNYPEAAIAPVAVTGKNGTVTFTTSKTGITGRLSEKGTPGITVEGKTIDTLTREFKLVPALIKIDVEGTEYDALLGAKATLKLKPRLLIEIHAQYDVAKIETLLKQQGYAGTYKGNNIWQFTA